jgi:hypothetical protein
MSLGWELLKVMGSLLFLKPGVEVYLYYLRSEFHGTFWNILSVLWSKSCPMTIFEVLSWYPSRTFRNVLECSLTFYHVLECSTRFLNILQYSLIFHGVP